MTRLQRPAALRDWSTALQGWGATAIVVLLGLLMGSALPADAQDTPAIVEARNRASAAAGAFVESRTRNEEIDSQIVALTSQVAANEDQMSVLRDAVAAVAVDRYIRTGRDLDLFTGQTAGNQAKAEAFSRLVNQSQSDLESDFRQLRDDLAAQRTQLDALRADAAAGLVEAEKLAASLQEELARVQVAEAARLAAEEAARNAAERERQRAAERAAAAAASARPRSLGAAAAPTPSLRISGNRYCPVAGSSSFFNSWGDSRSGGRRHKGVDMFAATWAPVVAVESGSTSRNDDNAGGIGQYLRGDSGISYYYAHLAGIETTGRVQAGQVIGYVGDTGNARSGPAHLHFEVHPGGWGTAVNPYPYTAQWCS